MLKLIDIVKAYKVEQDSILALKNVSIEFRRNEFVSILGPSGCGKTTLLNIIGGLDRYTSGDIRIDGVSTTRYDDVDWDTYRNRRVGFVFQSYNLIPHMNILKNVALALTIAGVSRDERRERALEALRKVGLDSQANKRPNQLSGGQMQRVAIARALVNNPEIILADEPTGALDTESGLQVMELLKEVAADRLVIMVTHNPDLAEKYSTRIVYLRDGEIEGDTMPYDSALEESAASGESAEFEGVEAEMKAEGAEADIRAEGDEASEEAVAEVEAQDASQETAQADTKPKAEKAKQKKPSRFLEKLRKIRKADKASMKIGTAISLSWNNLISKKGRTLLTSVAGSIGIIGIILVLALSNGARAYIDGLEESALSSYPITVNQTSMGIQEILSKMMSSATEDTGSVDDETIKVQKVLGNIVSELGNMMSASQNDLHTFKKYVDENFDKDLADVKYNYGTTFNCYVEDRGTSAEAQNRYMKVNPYTETMLTVFNQVLNSPLGAGLQNMEFNIMGQKLKFTDAISYLASMIGSAWSEMSSNSKMLQDQYELVSSRSHWPVRENEVVIVVDENNRLMDFQLFMLGLQSQDEVFDALLKGDEFSANEYDIEELLGLEYKVMNNVDYLEEDASAPGTWTMHPRTEQSKEYVNANCVTFSDGSDYVRVSGVVRPKKGAVATSIMGVIGYTSELTDYLVEQANKHPAVVELNKRFDEAYEAFQNNESTSYKSPIKYRVSPDGNDKSVGTVGLDVNVGADISFVNDNGQFSHESEHFTLLRQLGFADIEYPQSIEFFCSSFETKHAVEEFIAEYNKIDEKKSITYSDSLSSMMRFIDTMATTITGVLVAFAAISLIVSTIMIAIIIYTSVLERRKEIGVLRSIGARKKDISRVFIAESAILGGYSGVIGIFVSFLISLAGSAILTAVVGISGLMVVTWWHCVLMFGISVLLSMFAGFIPSRIAANKDPAIALRSE